MSVDFPTRTPAAPETERPGFPVYDPTTEPKLATPPPAAPANPLGDYHKVAQSEPGNERELMFTIGGIPLYAPRDEDIPPNLPFKMMRDMRRFGPQIAAINCMADLLGDEVIDLLAEPPVPISKEDWATIMEVLTDKVFSKVKDMPQPGKG